MDKFKIIIASDIDYNKLIAEIYYEDKFVALINQDNGLDKMIIEFPASNQSEYAIARNIPIEGFIDAINYACNLLSENTHKNQTY